MPADKRAPIADVCGRCGHLLYTHRLDGRGALACTAYLGAGASGPVYCECAKFEELPR